MKQLVLGLGMLVSFLQYGCAGNSDDVEDSAASLTNVHDVDDCPNGDPGGGTTKSWWCTATFYADVTAYGVNHGFSTSTCSDLLTNNQNDHRIEATFRATVNSVDENEARNYSFANAIVKMKNYVRTDSEGIQYYPYQGDPLICAEVMHSTSCIQK